MPADASVGTGVGYPYITENDYIIDRAGRATVSLFTRILFLPRISHLHNLLLLSLSSVFLNPIPFGAGVTSSEAFAMCVPLVTISSAKRVHRNTDKTDKAFNSRKRSILHFALAQVRALGVALEHKMVVNSNVSNVVQSQLSGGDVYSAWDIEQYIDRAISLADPRLNIDLKADICSAKHKLFDSETHVSEVSIELFEFIRNALESSRLHDAP
jgi:hypothetical protein